MQADLYNISEIGTKMLSYGDTYKLDRYVWDQRAISVVRYFCDLFIYMYFCKRMMKYWFNKKNMRKH